MKPVNIFLGAIGDVREFVNIASRFDFDVDLVSGRYSVDAKSVMGIFSLDLSKPITVDVRADKADEFLYAIEKFMVQ